MRTRQTDTMVTDTRTNICVAGPYSPGLNPVYWPSGQVHLLVGDYSRIDDVVGDYEGENPCYHFSVHNQWEHTGDPFKLDSLGTPISPPQNVLTGTIYGPPTSSLDVVWLNKSGQSMNHPTTTDQLRREQMPDFSAEAWGSIYPVIKDELKLINSFYELKDFRRLPGLIRKTRNAPRLLRELSNSWSWKSESAKQGELRVLYKLLEPQSADTWSTLLKLPRRRVEKLALAQILERLVSVGRLGSEHFLNWKFALEPLIRDVEAVSIASRAVDRQLPELLARADGVTVHKRHFARGIPESFILGVSPHAQDTAPWTGPYSQVSTRIWCEFTFGPKYVFTARYRYKYSAEALGIARQLAELDARGIVLSANNIWQATPWTFVLDWFVGIGKSLEVLTPHHLEPLVEFLGASHSLKYELMYGIDEWLKSYSEFPDAVLSGGGPKTTATGRHRCYIRKSVLPVFSIPKTSDFSTMEKALAMALGLSSVRYTTI